MDINAQVTQLKQKLAIVILAYADYMSLELALASHARFSVDSGVKIYILQNGRGTYDCERTYEVAKRYHYLFPDTIFVVDDIQPDLPFCALKALFKSNEFKQYSHIIKLDDDVMVLTPDWIDKLCACFLEGKQKYGKQFAYATSLVNNNPYGFKKIIESSKELANEYFTKIARQHYVGPDTGDDPFAPHRILPANIIQAGSNGTIWRYPHIARWLHEKTTLMPQEYIKLSKSLGVESVNNKERYSINCLLFEKQLWTNELSRVEPFSYDDEHLLQAYCIKHNKQILAELSIPMVHLFFFSQREACRDMMEHFRECYKDFLGLPFPITTHGDRAAEIENRLRFIEQKLFPPRTVSNSRRKSKNIIAGGMRCIQENGLKYTLKYAPKRIMRGRSA